LDHDYAAVRGIDKIAGTVYSGAQQLVSDYWMDLMKSVTTAVRTISGCMLIGLALPLIAHGQGSVYFKADAGGNLTSDTDLKDFFGQGVAGSKVKFDPGYRLGVGGGYEVCQFFAVEGEIASIGNNIKSITGAQRVDAWFVNVPFLVNAKLMGPRNWCVRPYIGGGAGGSASVLGVDHIDRGALHLHGTDSDIVFAFQGFAGLRFRINDEMGLAVEYRYFHADSPSWSADLDAGVFLPSDQLKFGRSETHSLSVVFDWHF
jgi:opacity protein-like surface antigen